MIALCTSVHANSHSLPQPIQLKLSGRIFWLTFYTQVGRWSICLVKAVLCVLHLQDRVSKERLTPRLRKSSLAFCFKCGRTTVGLIKCWAVWKAVAWAAAALCAALELLHALCVSCFCSASKSSEVVFADIPKVGCRLTSRLPEQASRSTVLRFDRCPGVRKRLELGGSSFEPAST